MAPKAIRPENDVVSCAVCGRRLLQGERPEVYLVSGERRMVCELCTVRANHQGWIRESAGLQLGSRGPGRDERRARLRERLRGLRERPASNGSDGGGVGEGGLVPGVDHPHEPRHIHAVPTSDELKAARALELFNASEHPRTVSGIARSLGAPVVAVRADALQTSLVSITVAWELCWYRYEVDLANEGPHGARLVGQGYELAELPPEDQAANAAADEHGVLLLAEPA
jgi:hypothetical protein